MALVNIKIEGVPYQVEEGLTILEAAKKCGYEIPTLCAFNHGECNKGSCRVCLVEATRAPAAYVLLRQQARADSLHPAYIPLTRVWRSPSPPPRQ